jgi:hypothetical protein
MTRITLILALAVPFAVAGCSTSQNNDLPPPEIGSNGAGASSSAAPAAGARAESDAN